MKKFELFRIKTKELKFCAQCDWSLSADDSRVYDLRCHCPIVNRHDSWALSGAAVMAGTSCSTERSQKGFFAICGIKGKQWKKETDEK